MPCAFHNLIPIFPLSIQLHQTHQNQINRNQIEPTPITIMHILLVHRNYGEVIYGLMIPAGYIGSQVYMADTMTYYSTLPTVFYFSEWAPLSISYSSLLFKPPSIPSYFSSFQIELRTGPLLIPIVSLRVLLCSNPSSYSYQFLCHRLQYDTQEICRILKTYNSDLFLQPQTRLVFNTILSHASGNCMGFHCVMESVILTVSDRDK